MHYLGQVFAVILMIIWWRAMLHLLDSVEAFVGGWEQSDWGWFSFLGGFTAIPIHLISEPIYLLQLVAITAVLYLTVNRQGYRDPVYTPYRPDYSGAKMFIAAKLFWR